MATGRGAREIVQTLSALDIAGADLLAGLSAKTANQNGSGRRKWIGPRIESEFEAYAIGRCRLPTHVKLACLHVVMDDEALYAVEQGFGQIIQIERRRCIPEFEPDGDPGISPARSNIGHVLAKELV